MDRLFARQRAKASGPGGSVDIDALGELVTAAYEQAERDRRRTARFLATEPYPHYERRTPTGPTC